MNCYVILAQSNHTSRALKTLLQDLYNVQLTDEPNNNVLAISIENSIDEDNSELFSNIINEIDGRFSTNSPSLQRLIIVADEINLSDADVLQHHGWNALLTMLILSLPEANWKFGQIKGAGAGDDAIVFLHSMPSLLHPHWNSLLDGSGLRTRLLSNIQQPLSGIHIPLRKNLAIAIDDEPAYAGLHAYSAYRFGYRAFQVSSNQLTQLLLGPESLCSGVNVGTAKERHLTLTFEDLYLSFQDASSLGYSQKSKRDALLPGLNQSLNPNLLRYFVTMGRNSDLAEAGMIDANVIYKPVDGIFGLWREAGFFNPEVQKGDLFVWPKETVDYIANASPIIKSHSSPGPIKQVAHYLVQRAIRLIDNIVIVDDAILGAVMAGIALELLGDKEPTTAHKSYLLKQRFEVSIESLIGGMVFPFDLTARINEIKSELTIFSKWSGQKNAVEVMYNNELVILNYFEKHFEDKNEFEKAEFCRIEARNIQRQLWWCKYKSTKFIITIVAGMFLVIRWYIDLLLSSITKVFIAIAGWIGIFWFLYAYASKSFASAFISAINAFFGGSIPQLPTNFENYLGATAVICGFFHLGIFISHLYSISSRR